jgi:hypothetical protein
MLPWAAKVAMNANDNYRRTPTMQLDRLVISSSQAGQGAGARPDHPISGLTGIEFGGLVADVAIDRIEELPR